MGVIVALGLGDQGLNLKTQGGISNTGPKNNPKGNVRQGIVNEIPLGCSTFHFMCAHICTFLTCPIRFCTLEPIRHNSLCHCRVLLQFNVHLRLEKRREYKKAGKKSLKGREAAKRTSTLVNGLC